MGLKLNPDYLDESTWRKVRTNLEQAGVYYLHFPSRSEVKTGFGRTRHFGVFLEPSYVATPAMMNILTQSKGSG